MCILLFSLNFSKFRKEFQPLCFIQARILRDFFNFFLQCFNFFLNQRKFVLAVLKFNMKNFILTA